MTEFLLALIEYNMYLAIVVFLFLLLVHLYTLLYMMCICILTACYWWLPYWNARIQRAIRRLTPQFWWVLMLTILLHYNGFRLFD